MWPRERKAGGLDVGGGRGVRGVGGRVGRAAEFPAAVGGRAGGRPGGRGRVLGGSRHRGRGTAEIATTASGLPCWRRGSRRSRRCEGKAAI